VDLLSILNAAPSGYPACGYPKGQRNASNGNHGRDQSHGKLAVLIADFPQLRSISGSINHVFKCRSSSISASLAVNRFSPASFAGNDRLNSPQARYSESRG
jgi:hypothetical protein